MKKEYVMGNGAIALGALSAGVNLVTGYPGTLLLKFSKIFRSIPMEAFILNGP